MKKLTYEEAYIKCLDIASKHAETAYAMAEKTKSQLMEARAKEAWDIYQSMGALMLRLPNELGEKYDRA